MFWGGGWLPHPPIPHPIREQEGVLGMNRKKEQSWAWVPIPKKDPPLGQKPVLQRQQQEVQREQRQSSLAPELETQPPSPTQDPIQPGVPRPINCLHLSRCPSCHSNHLLPDVSLATGQEWCTFLLLPPGSTLSSVSS